MKYYAIIFSFFFANLVWAQQAPPPGPATNIAPAAAVPAATPPPVAPQPAVSPVAVPSQVTQPAVNTTGSAPVAAPIPAIAPIKIEEPKPLSSGGDLEVNANKRIKSPFMIPTELYLKIKRNAGEKSAAPLIDTNVEVRRRWPIKEYTLVGVIWNVKNPKAMIADKEGKVHTFKMREFIANAGGYITEIHNGEVIVLERGAEVKLKLKDR